MRQIKVPLIYEDELPANITDADYDKWFKESNVVDGVRMGPLVGSESDDPLTEGIESVLFIRCMAHREVMQLNNSEGPGECGECVRRDAVLADRASLAFLISAIPVVTGEQFQRFKTLDEFREQVLGLVIQDLKEHAALHVTIQGETA